MSLEVGVGGLGMRMGGGGRRVEKLLLVVVSRRLGSGGEEDGSHLVAISGRRSKGSSHGSQAPFLDVGLDEDEAGLAEVDVHRGRPGGPDGRKQVESVQPHIRILQFLSVPREEHRARPRPIADPQHITFLQRRAVRGRGEWVVVRLEAITREVSYR